MDASGGEAGDQGSLSTWNSDIGIPIHFQNESGIVTFWSLEFRVPLEVSKWCDSHIQMRRSTMAFSRVSTGDSDIPSSCEMQHEPEFKPLQGSPAFFWVRISRGPFHFRQESQGPSHITISEGKLHLRCWWKVGSDLQSKTGNQLSSWDDMGCMELSYSWCTDINIHIDLRRVSHWISVDSSRKSSHLYCMLWNTG